MLEARPTAQYAVVARMIPSLKRELGGLRYERLNPTGKSRNWNTILTIGHTPGVALWRVSPSRRKRPKADLVCHEALRLSSLAHEPSVTPAGVWHFYDGRAGMERRIREIREDYALTKIPTRAFEANALYLEVVRLAYNLVTAFQRTCLPQEWQSLTLSKLRHRLFWLPGELTRPQNRPTLRLVNSPLVCNKG